MDTKRYEELFFRDITSLGGLFFYAIVCAVLLSMGETHLVLQLVFAIALITIVALIVRSIYFRPRPKEQRYSNFLERLDASSFPSIHAARIWALAFLVGETTSKMTFITLAIIAVLVCFSRIALKKHHASDVIVGTILGLAVAWIV